MRAAYAEETGVGPRPTAGGSLPRPVIEVVERDDGLISAAPAARYLAKPAHWPPFELRALDRVKGRTLDIGTGAGRVALALSERGVAVVGLDISPGAVEVAGLRGVRETVCTTIDEYARRGETFDTMILFGNNIGLFEGRDRAPVFLAALAALARPGARVIAQGTIPYGRADEVHNAYYERNHRLGRMGGQQRCRIRYRDLASDWFDYLICTPEELRDLLAGSPWHLAEVDDLDAPFYTVTLILK